MLCKTELYLMAILDPPCMFQEYSLMLLLQKESTSLPLQERDGSAELREQ